MSRSVGASRIPHSASLNDLGRYGARRFIVHYLKSHRPAHALQRLRHFSDHFWLEGLSREKWTDRDDTLLCYCAGGSATGLFLLNG